MPITLTGVSYSYKGAPEGQRALDDITLTVPRGRCVGILGSNGSGKTTLIRHMNGLYLPDEGEVRIGDLVLGPSSRRPASLSREIGLVFQFPEKQLFADTVFEDVAAGLHFAGVDAGDVPGRVEAALEAAGLDPAAVRDRSPFSLTWGEKRKVAVAGTLVMDCPRLIFDEPGAGLDPRERMSLLALVEKLVRKEGRTVVFVSHHLDELFRVADSLVVLAGGRVVFEGNPEELCRQDDPGQWGLRWPPLVSLMNEMAARGIAGKADVRTPEEAAAVLERLLRT